MFFINKKYMSLKVKIFLIIIFEAVFIFAQKRDIQFEQLTIDDGLSANTVLSLLQDSRGFLWIGTYNGLNKYDGYNFIVYNNSPDDSSSISDNQIRSLCEDSNGDIWIGIWEGGLNKFNRATEKFTRYEHNPNDRASISPGGIFALSFDKSGNLWLGTQKSGVDYFDLKTGIFHHYKHNPDDPYSLSADQIYDVHVDRNDDLWVGTAANGLNKYIKEKQHFISFKHLDNDANGISGNKIASIYEDALGKLWIATRDGGLNKFDPSSNKFKCYKHDPKNPNSLSDDDAWIVYGDSKSFLWIGHLDGGLNLFDSANETFTVFRKDYNNPYSLSDDEIFTIYEDRTSIIWVGTWNGGLNKYDRMKKKFVTYSHNPKDNNSLSPKSVFAIYKDKLGELWVGTAGKGLNRIDERNNKFTHYSHNRNDLGSISSNYIYSICEDKEGYLWVSSDNAGINRFDRKTNKFIRFQHDLANVNSISTNLVSQIFCDSYGDLWVGVSGNGLDKFNQKQNSFIHYKHDPEDPKSIKPDLVFSLYEDKSRNLWIGTYGGGLMKYNRQTDDFIFFEHDPNKLNSLSSNLISAICEDENGILWIGTNGAGLNRFDTDKNQIKRYSEKNGLPNDIICGILADNSGNLWISTGKGISKFNFEHESFINYDKSDGLQGDEFNNWAYYKSSNGEMYFGGPNGVNCFNPGELSKNPNIPQIAITDFQILHEPVAVGYDTILGRTVLKKSITVTDTIELTYDENIISFEIVALDFHYPEKNQYEYFMEGIDKNWIQTDATDRAMTYTNLDPGEYTLRIRGSNNDGVWNKAGISLKVIIHPPWWATWWSYMLYGFVFIMVFITSTRIYLHRHRLRTQLALEHEHAIKLEEVDKLKSNFYANISHEFRTPLMLILGPVEKLASKLIDEDSKKQTGLIKGNAKRLLNLINQLLDLSRLEAKKLKLNASFGNIAQYVKGLAKEFEQIAEQRDISLNILIEKENIDAYFDKEKMERIITNVMSNAIKFTPHGGRITVKLNETSHKEIEITVRDSGLGIPKNELAKIFNRFYQVDGSHTREHEGTGIGLALTKELVELHKGQILIDSVEGNWTEVKIYFPLGRDHLTDDEISEPSELELHKFVGTEDFGINGSVCEETEDENLIDKTIVLIVEDNPDVRDYIKDDLKEIYHIEEAANGEQGLRKAQKCIPDLIVSDVMMPKMDGYEMTRELRQDEKTSHIPIILLTAKSDRDSKLEGLGLGADDYLTKPFDTQELLARIKNLIETRRLLQEKFGAGTVVLHKPEKTKLSCLDQQFLDKVMMVIDQHISEEQFSIEEFGKDVGMSRSQIHRKLKALTGKSTSLYLRTVRLAKAKQMIEQKKANISEISYQVGFSSPAYFSRCFKEEFGFTPSETSTL